MLFVLLVIAFALLLLLLFGTWKFLQLLVATWRSDGSNRFMKRASVALVVCGLFALPFVAQFFAAAAQTASRIPAPLVASKVEFGEEEAFGFGPGGNETGFLIYKLKRNSEDWLRAKGQALGEHLPGGNDVWLQTPIVASDANEPWFMVNTATDTTSEVPTIANFLNRYGFSISIDAQKENELNASLLKVGCWYSYGPGGSVTIIDPKLGRVYFAYSG